MATTIFPNVEINEQVSTKEYRLMYFFGTWVTKEIIYAENDKEAIFDADMTMEYDSLRNWEKSVALWCGNRKVKSYIDKPIYDNIA